MRGRKREMERKIERERKEERVLSEELCLRAAVTERDRGVAFKRR